MDTVALTVVSTCLDTPTVTVQTAWHWKVTTKRAWKSTSVPQTMEVASRFAALKRTKATLADAAQGTFLVKTGGHAVTSKNAKLVNTAVRTNV